MAVLAVCSEALLNGRRRLLVVEGREKDVLIGPDEALLDIPDPVPLDVTLPPFSAVSELA